MFHLQNELTIFIVRLNNLIITRDFKNKNELKINPSKYLFIYLYKFNSFQPLYVCKRIYYFSATASKSASSSTTFFPSKHLFIYLYKFNFCQTAIHLLSEVLNIAGYNAPTIKYPAMYGK